MLTVNICAKPCQVGGKIVLSAYLEPENKDRDRNLGKLGLPNIEIFVKKE